MGLIGIFFVIKILCSLIYYFIKCCRDTVDRVVAHMTSQGIKIAEGVQPRSITKTAAGKLRVEFTDGRPAEEFDTVLAAIGKMYKFLIS